jgi:hypothetical protein
VLVPRRLASTRESIQQPLGVHAGGHTRGTKDRRVASGLPHDASSVANDEAGQDGNDESIAEDDDGLNDDEAVVLEGEQELSPPSDSLPTTRSGRRV